MYFIDTIGDGKDSYLDILKRIDSTISEKCSAHIVVTGDEDEFLHAGRLGMNQGVLAGGTKLLLPRSAGHKLPRPLS